MSYQASAPKWYKVTKTFSDFAIAGLTNDVSIFTLPAKGVVHAISVNPSTTFSGGIIASYTLSIGVTGNPVRYAAANSIFTGATLNTSTGIAINDLAAPTDIRAYAISTVGNLNAATQGSVDIWMLISTLP